MKSDAIGKEIVHVDYNFP